MEQELVKIFRKAKYYNEECGIWQAIVMHEKQNTRIKTWVFFVLGLASLTGIVPACAALANDLTKSGFYEYFSLVFSDGRSIFSYWKEFAFSLAESLPLLSIILTLSLFFIFFFSLWYMIKQINKGQLMLASS